MEFSFDNKPEDNKNSSFSNDRLKRAIEKNRLKNLEKNNNQNNNEINLEQSLRKEPTTPENIEIVSPIKKIAKKNMQSINYSNSVKKDSINSNFNFYNYLVKACWGFCFIIVLRLIFANGGILAFNSQKNIYQKKLEELEKIKKENMLMVEEIEKIQSNATFQKKLVRDNLGFIAKDEYLIIFPKE